MLRDECFAASDDDGNVAVLLVCLDTVIACVVEVRRQGCLKERGLRL